MATDTKMWIRGGVTVRRFADGSASVTIADLFGLGHLTYALESTEVKDLIAFLDEENK